MLNVDERRSHPRKPLRTNVLMHGPNKRGVADLLDASHTGARVNLHSPCDVGESVKMLVQVRSNYFLAVKARVVWAAGGQAGLAFEEGVAPMFDRWLEAAA